MEKTNAEKIQELKALRAELLAYKERQDSEASDGSTDQSAAIGAMRKAYVAEYENVQSDSKKISEARQQLTTQYYEEESTLDDNNQEKAYTLTRRR